MKRRETSRVARKNEDHTVVRVVQVVWMTVVRVEPPIVIVVIDIEDVQITVRVRIV